MTEILTAPSMDRLNDIAVLHLDSDKKASVLPQPKTFYMLCALPKADKEFSSGIAKSDQTQRNEEILSPVLFVMKMGPDCYKDANKFPSGPSCKEGDFVLVRPNTGTRIKIYGNEFRLIADDNVEAVIADPRGIERAA